MKNNKKAELIEGSIIKTLVTLTIPMIFGMISLVAFNLTDTFFVGRLGAKQLAALSFTYPVVLIINSIALGLGVGASSVVSRAIGEGDPHRVQRLTTDSLSLAISIVAVFVGIGLFTVEPLFRKMGAEPEILVYIKQYMEIWYLGMPFVVVPMVGNNAIRATGDTRTPSLVMMIAATVNIILDPTLIFGLWIFPKLGVSGAALATVFSRMTTFSVSLYILGIREKMLTFERVPFRKVYESWKKVLYVGVPTAGTRIIIPLAAGIITRLVSEYGSEAVAAFGVGARLEFFALTVVMSLASVLGPFVGQNWGAGKRERVKLSVKYSQRFSIFWGILMFLLFAFFARGIAGIFNKNPKVITVLALYLQVVPIGYGLQGVLLLSGMALNVLNKPLYAAALSFLQMFVLYVPLALLGSRLFGLMGIFSALPISNIIAGITAAFVIRRFLQKQEAS